jgi:PAS domain S-box-containing protein
LSTAKGEICYHFRDMEIPSRLRLPWGLLGWRSLLALVAAASASLLLAGVYYRREQARVLRDAHETLAVAAELKTGQFRDWLDRYRADAEALRAGFFLADEVGRLISRPQDRGLRAEFLGWLWAHKNYLRYRSVQLLDHEGRVLVAAGSQTRAADPEENLLLRRAAESGRVASCDFTLDPANGLCVDQVVPIQSRSGGRTTGFIVLQTDAEATLLPLLESWPTASRSGEITVFCRKNDRLVWLTRPRHAPSTPSLAFSVSLAAASRGGLIAAMAAEGREGAVEGLDYRGVPVVAQMGRIPGTGWHLVAKMDRDEVLAQVHVEAWLTALLVLAFLVSVGMLVNLLRNVRVTSISQRNEADLRELLDAAPLGVFILRKRLVAWGNAAGLEMAGYGAPAEIKEMPILDLIDPARHGEMGEYLRAWGGGRPVPGHFETLVLRRDGTSIAVHGRMARFSFDGTPAVAVFLRDVTEERRAENDRVRQEKLQTVTTLTGGIAHDINNLLTAVTGNLSLAEMKLDDPARARENLGDAARAAQQIKELVNRLSAYAGGVEPERISIDVRPLLEEAVERVRIQRPFRAEWRLAPRLRPLLGDRPRLLRTMEEIVANAAEAGSGPGKDGEAPGAEPVVTLEVEDIELAQRSNRPPFEPGYYLRIRVSDRGGGIPADILPHVFDPYFSTKHAPAVKGPGLGLHFVQAIVRKHRGHLAIESVPGEGATVTLILPAAPPPAPEN